MASDCVDGYATGRKMREEGKSLPLVIFVGVVLIAAVYGIFRLLDDRIHDSDDFRRQFEAAVKVNDIAQIKKVMERNRSTLDPSSDVGMLRIVVHSGSVFIARLVFSKSSIDYLDECLLEAVQENKPQMIEFLLDQGANPDSRIAGGLGKTLLFYAKHYAEIRGNPFIYDAIKLRAKPETVALADAEEREERRRKESAVDCRDLSRYAEAKGHGFIERSVMVGDARRKGLCK